MTREHKASLFFGALLTATLIGPPGQIARAETLLDALRAADAANSSLAAERARQSAVSEAVPQAFAQGLPTISTTFDAGQTEEKFHTPDAVSERDPVAFSVTTSVPLFRGFRTYNSVREARARARAGDHRLSATSQQLSADVAEAYATVLRDRRIVRLRADNIDFLTSEVSATLQRMKAGEQSLTDVAQAEARLEGARADLSGAEADLVESEARYVSLVDHPPGKLAPVTLPNSLIPASLEEAISLAEHHGPLVAAAREEAAAASHQLQIRKGELLPTVSLEASYETRYDDSASFDAQEETSILARVTVPLFEGGARLSRIREAGSRSFARHHDLAQTRHDTAASVKSAFRRRLAATDRIKASNAQLRAARTALKGVRLEAEVGQRSVIDILDAQRELIDARVFAADAEREMTVATFRLLAAIGRADPHMIIASFDTQQRAPEPNEQPIPAPSAKPRQLSNTQGLRRAIFE